MKTSTKIQKISNSRSTGTLSSRLQTSFRQSTFGVFLLGMRPISRTGLSSYQLSVAQQWKFVMRIWCELNPTVRPRPTP
ncbi:MAG: hypothetical protein MUF45_13245 [Spirosomaceae bacterium]|nr:hypothetical protein [Spirosomataceae bacterium]